MANRQYKDTVFRAFLNHEHTIAELYQAIRPQDVVRAEDITITTLDAVFLDQRKNDLSFRWKDQAVVLVEHQSTISPNLPYRLYVYSALVLLSSFVDSKAQYATKPMKIPALHFYVLYIGDDMKKDTDTLKLSDLFKEKEADVELVCHVINITYKEHRAILERCRPLKEYSYFVHRVDEDKKRGMTLDEAIRETIAYCIAHGIMKEFLEEHREEVLKMFALKWDAEEEKKVLREEAVEEGMEKGLEQGRVEAARSLMETLNCSKEKAMELLKIPADLRPKVLALL